MTEHSYTVEVQPDFLERQSKARPVQAVAELIWNGLDADASRVDVRLEYDELGMTKIVVRDDGRGIPYEDAPQLFTRLGGSWKHPGGRTKTKERMLHGYEGRGRFKVFALGRVADWRVTSSCAKTRPFSNRPEISSLDALGIRTESRVLRAAGLASDPWAAGGGRQAYRGCARLAQVG